VRPRPVQPDRVHHRGQRGHQLRRSPHPQVRGDGPPRDGAEGGAARRAGGAAGGKGDEGIGYDLTGLFVGSEGTLGLATEITLRLIRLPQGYRTLLGIFDSVEAASQTVSDIIEQGIVPGAMEMLDQLITRAVEEAFRFGFPLDAGAILIIELDGLEVGLDQQAEAVKAICRRNGVREIREASDPRSRAHLWAARKKAFGATGRLAASYVTQDGV